MENQIQEPNLNSKPHHSTTPAGSSPSPSDNPDEINLLEYLYALVHWKWLIVIMTLIGFGLGNVAALKKGPKWFAEVLIAPKETESQKTPSISGLGALGGMVASQINFGGNANLDKIDLVLNNREFNYKLVEKYNLLPLIYRGEWPKTYKGLWDSTKQQWKPGFVPPPPLSIGGMVKGLFLKKTVNKNNTMLITIKSKDSTLSITLAEKYVQFLDEYIKASVQSDAKENVSYLEKQLNGIADPLLREKIQSLIASEIEKQMVVSKEAFRIVDPVFLYKGFKEKGQYPKLFGGGMFAVACVFIILMQAFASGKKTEEDKRLLFKMKKELIPFVKWRE
jgi:hypothetical protein